MSGARYAPLANPRTSSDAQREMDDAFEDDDASDCGETTPLNEHRTTSSMNGPRAMSGSRGMYDFERDYSYDRPPPGSPPRPSSVALPNSYGNSNGYTPTSPVARAVSRPSVLRRTIGALLPSRYQPLQAPAEAPGRGGGTQNDGVFANVVAKPSAPVMIQSEDGNVYMAPEVVQAEAPPVRPVPRGSIPYS